MDNPIKISVLMLAYNQRPYIDEAIRSVMLQHTHFDYELIIGDDCSTDGTAASGRRATRSASSCFRARPIWDWRATLYVPTRLRAAHT